MGWVWLGLVGKENGRYDPSCALLLQVEDELKKAALERRRDKEEEQVARERVKAQIEQDWADRAAR